MLGLLGISPLELIILAGLCCVGLVVAAVVIGTVLFLNRQIAQRDAPRADAEKFAENLPQEDDSQPSKA